MKYYLIDYENVNASGLDGIEDLTTDCRIVLFYTKNSSKIDLGIFTQLRNTEAELVVIEVHHGKQALDIQLGSYVGYLIGTEPIDTEYYIVSKDKGYRNIQDFWSDRRIVLCTNLREDSEIIDEPAPEKKASGRSGSRGGRKTSSRSSAKAGKPVSKSSRGSSRSQKNGKDESTEQEYPVVVAETPVTAIQAVRTEDRKTQNADNASGAKNADNVSGAKNDRDADAAKNGRNAQGEKNAPAAESEKPAPKNNAFAEAAALAAAMAAAKKEEQAKQEAAEKAGSAQDTGSARNDSSEKAPAQKSEPVKDEPKQAESKQDGSKQGESENTQKNAAAKESPKKGTSKKAASRVKVSELRNEANTEIQKILSKEGYAGDIINATASFVSKNIGKDGYKQLIYRGIIKEHGQKQGLAIYRLIKGVL